MVLLVVTPVASVARWAAQPIELGHPGWDLKPLVLGPAQIPVVASAAEARAAPELAVLSALAHGPGARGLAVAKAVCEGLLTLDIPRKDFYLDLILVHLNAAARLALERLMLKDYQYQSEFMRRLAEEAVARARAEALAQGVA